MPQKSREISAYLSLRFCINASSVTWGKSTKSPIPNSGPSCIPAIAASVPRHSDSAWWRVYDIPSALPCLEACCRFDSEYKLSGSGFSPCGFTEPVKLPYRGLRSSTGHFQAEMIVCTERWSPFAKCATPHQLDFVIPALRPGWIAVVHNRNSSCGRSSKDRREYIWRMVGDIQWSKIKVWYL